MPRKKKESISIDWEMFREFVTEFKDESDRAAVVLGAAKLNLVIY